MWALLLSSVSASAITVTTPPEELQMTIDTARNIIIIGTARGHMQLNTARNFVVKGLAENRLLLDISRTYVILE